MKTVMMGFVAGQWICLQGLVLQGYPLTPGLSVLRIRIHPAWTQLSPDFTNSLHLYRLPCLMSIVKLDQIHSK